MSCSICSAYRFYVIDLQDGTVRGTDDEETANEFSSHEYYCVINVFENNNISVYGTYHIEEAK